MSNRKSLPTAVARQLRQESGFGCAVCGNPIIEYHHIIEWQERQHFDPEHMIALCPTHHTEYGKLPKAKCYSAKQNPINIRNKRIKGYLGGNKSQKAVRIGAMTVANCKSLIDFSGISLFSYNFIGEEYALNVFLPDQNFWPEIEIRENQLIAETGKFWDIEFKTNWVKFKRFQKGTFLEVDFRGDEIEIDGAFSVGGVDFELKEKKSQVGGIILSSIHFENFGTGFSFGPPGRILRPNYAMTSPNPVHIPHF
ncbi:HNH endonuclease signature motif containing protein [Epibacterium ulvae]|uniref:HNH endonuclease signature motif containing protein n=1 Tax=Epibacterium ulvae TaxID=1156985 RepID=UPI0024902FF0|nr:HNH endonuclease signature motif containing protein [Epibacterium ulvae]